MGTDSGIQMLETTLKIWISFHFYLNLTEEEKKKKNGCRIYFETVFTQKLLVNFTNNNKEMANTLN